MVIDSEEKPKTLFKMVKETLTDQSKGNSIIAFHDNSSSIRGYECDALKPTSAGKAGPMSVQKQTLHPILTAETHNFPCGVAPFAGAETGTGGRLRDVMATGRGAYPVAGVSSYCVIVHLWEILCARPVRRNEIMIKNLKSWRGYTLWNVAKSNY